MQIPRLNQIFPAVTGILFSLYYAAGSFDPARVFLNLNLVGEGIMLAILLPFVFHLMLRWFHQIVAPVLLQETQLKAFYRYQWLGYLIFWVPALAGIESRLALVLVLIIVFLLLQGALLLALTLPARRRQLLASERYIAVLFLISGFSALIYQVVWQRVLFTTFGIHTAAVTVIVSVFMFGLGVGALAGGYLQKRFSNYLLPIFVVLEVCIGIFGLFSLSFIHLISRMALNSSNLELIGWSYLILAFPTLLMGATLPILVAFLQKYFNNLGKTVGLLYAFNTIGSAIAAFCTVEILFVYLGQSGTLVIAACCNLLTAGLIFHASGRLGKVSAMAEVNGSAGVSPGLPGLQSLPYGLVFFSLMAIGYISLSQEILWFRLLGVLTGGKPQIFGLLLTAFLIGIASGSLRSKSICEHALDPYQYTIRALLMATLIFYLAVPAVSFSVALIGQSAGPVLAYVLVGILAYYTGGLLPMLIHIGVGKQQDDSTLAMSWLYFANIIGATGGPMLTGFVLLEHFTLEQNVLILSVITLFLLLVILLFVPQSGATKRKSLVVVVSLCLVAGIFHKNLFYHYLEKLQFASFDTEAFKYKVENRAGIITVEKSGSDIVFGGGKYDGRFNINPEIDNNGISRTFMLAALHRNPERVLEIGLSTGSWAHVLSNYQRIKSMSVVEINPGYAELIRHYPDIATILDAPKISFIYDDGRRWLKNHPDQKFDVILMNTTYHWRSNVTNLLSLEFLQLCKKHLNKGGVIYYNTTGSRSVTYTTAHVFKYVTTYQNFVAGSDEPFNLTEAEKTANFLQFQDRDGQPLFSRNEIRRSRMDSYVKQKLPELQDSIKHDTGLYLITDDNMAVEYKTRDDQ